MERGQPTLERGRFKGQGYGLGSGSISFFLKHLLLLEGHQDTRKSSLCLPGSHPASASDQSIRGCRKTSTVGRHLTPRATCPALSSDECGGICGTPHMPAAGGGNLPWGRFISGFKSDSREIAKKPPMSEHISDDKEGK